MIANSNNSYSINSNNSYSINSKPETEPDTEVTAEERGGAKRICYGLLYGIGAGRLAVELGISRLQAQEFQASFMREYEGCAAWVQQCCDRARQCGFVETLHGLEIVQATFKIA